MMYNLRPRFTTLHLAQRLRIEGETFMMSFSFENSSRYSQTIDYTLARL